MKIRIVCISLAALAILSCEEDKSGTHPAESQREGSRTTSPTIAERQSSSRHGSADTDSRNRADSPIIQTGDAKMVRPVGTAPQDASWHDLTVERQVELFKSKGIAGIPRRVSETILDNASRADSPEARLAIITRETSAWHHIHAFTEREGPVPEHMRRMLLETLMEKHGESWSNIVPELDEQIAASVRIDALRTNGIPGMSAEASEDFIIKSIEKYGSDYKAILSEAMLAMPRNPESQ